MKILGTNIKEKTIELKSADIVLSIKELDGLIDFLFKAKQRFLDRQKDGTIKKLIEKNNEFNVEAISSYKEIIKHGYEQIEDHMHFIDEYKLDHVNNCDIVIHTMFQATCNDDDNVKWVNIE